MPVSAAMACLHEDGRLREDSLARENAELRAQLNALHAEREWDRGRV